MTGQEHFDKAAELLAASEKSTNSKALLLATQAQTHALLAISSSAMKFSSLPTGVRGKLVEAFLEVRHAISKEGKE